MKPFKTTTLNSYWIFLPSLIALLTFTLFSTQATAQQTSYQSHDSLYQLVLNHLKQKTDQKLFNADFQLQTLSRHINFPQCQTPLNLRDRTPEKITGRNTFQITCAAPEWKVTVSATISGDLPVIIATQGILQQAMIKPEDVQRILVPHKRVRRGGFTQVEQVIGLRAKRSMGPNTILTVRLVQPPYWAFKDKKVTLVTQVGNIKIETKGIALKSGVEQEQIPVKNLSSKKTVKGIIIAPNTVWIP